ncbi:Cof-type HAD-IIB family hydrolase [Paenibacillus sp. LHD-38]|uniref:Cof-type HAD-IIB family hydrolase n=1 Tax=Paenibacillus sp. LHD-38 TaxID=3072143 RepID=UPI0028100431|nr:Cof-type HAD-IIB family hydrolase [Paenibacillus sp. LHD-38]MDQ8733619.1 Cof-type HAD-IIB family hydrolase [Paenibacillus sp. LHD-38]
MTKKLIFFDIDGTLVDHEKKIPPSTKQAIELLQEDGHELVIATGRGPFMLKPVSEALNIESYVCFNGSYAVYNGEVVYSHPIDPARLAELSEITLKNKHPLVYMTPEGMRSSTHQTAYVEEENEPLKKRLPPLDPEYHLGKEIYQCLLYCKEEDESCYKENFPELGFIRWHLFGSDILPPGGSKAKGIQALIEKAGVMSEDVYAFGDGINDLEMLRYVYHSVAMGNASDEVKQAARYVTKDVTEDGIMYGLRMLGLLKE